MHRIKRKLILIGLWDKVTGGLGQVFALDGSHLTAKKGDDVTKVVDEKDKSSRPPKVTSNVMSRTEKVVVDVKPDQKIRLTQPSTPKGGQRVHSRTISSTFGAPSGGKAYNSQLNVPQEALNFKEEEIEGVADLLDTLKKKSSIN